MDKERQEELEWFVQFANMDLSQLKPGDRAKLVVESEEYLFPQGIKGINFEEFEIPYVQINMFYTELKWAFKRPSIDSPQYFDKLLEFQKTVREALNELLEREVEGVGGMEIWKVLFIKRNDPDKFVFASIPIAGKQTYYIRTRLNILFNGLSRSTLERCPGCEKYYLNFTKRRKRFCSPKCMWKVNAEKRREELKKHPGKYKSYLKKQRELMRRKYEQKRKEG